jgi:hypothetical protein
MSRYTDDVDEYLMDLKVQVICKNGHSYVFYPWELADANRDHKCDYVAYEGGKPCRAVWKLSPPQKIGRD